MTILGSVAGMEDAQKVSSSPLYSYTPEEVGNLPLVLSIACAERRHDECDAWFRCDCEHHRRRTP
jgi:hypothetical protein